MNLNWTFLAIIGCFIYIYFVYLKPIINKYMKKNKKNIRR